MKRIAKHLGIWLSLLSFGVCMETEQQEANQRMNLIVEAFQGVGLQPSYVLTHSNEVDVFTTVPQNFLKFVKSKGDVPLDWTRKIWDRHPPLHHCDFSKAFQWTEHDGYLWEHISLGSCGFSAPDIAIRLWGHRESKNKQVLVTLDSAAFHIDIYRMDRENEDLKRGLEEFVSKGMKEGFYVVVPDDVERVDWRENPDIIKHFSTEMHHRYIKTVI